MQTAHGSNTSLASTFLYQVNVESKNYMECKELQRKIEKIMEDQGFYQTSGGFGRMDSRNPNAYVDARTYKGQEYSIRRILN